MTTTPFDITREEVLELAARKLVDAFADESDLSEQASRMIKERVEEKISATMNKRIEEVLTAEIARIMTQEICPVDIWGEKTGQTTTIRDQLAARARAFWDVKVDEDGKESNWGGEPRHQHLYKRIAKDEFCKAIKENSDTIAAVFKDALKADAARIAADHIDKLINIKASR